MVWIEDVLDGDALALYGGSLTLIDSHVRNIGPGAALGLYSAEALVEKSVFEQGLESGLELYDTSSLFLSESTVQDFDYGGMELYDSSATVERSRLLRNGSGLVLYGASGAEVDASSIVNNTRSGFPLGLPRVPCRKVWKPSVSKVR